MLQAFGLLILIASNEKFMNSQSYEPFWNQICIKMSESVLALKNNCFYTTDIFRNCIFEVFEICYL
ncbi:MAG TPA: hypothetical protein DCQ26_04065 [Marinilabiliales bacterium]|nr:MAG: hypothetical protein A2W95_03375 [Bacteroidetes bacterium GWA2_40_14]OFX58104.1 MAG: hypothetical protein A2W84_09050 [Bacteroidetes bacterium GWC2_40_13]OFX72742.1 MAG: hypothetical protein A2W96_18560 [Bacteroidetes bacterium GWD2_40_43]OFX91372.1 MAG: hypothetical protein A2W97_03980 [Bacteroidetes bacterium GWE2_40_63]OFY19441.1 MAG: hypothetical protein A2W88_01860 [Bacteroidetes bacterium GWF2_40_13]OFZ25590.1 MAG: hypothetical protein A2437_12265 [Bacteroidetes bacterium RIFOXYC